MIEMVSKYGNEVVYINNEKEKEKYIDLGFTEIKKAVKAGRKSGNKKAKSE